MFDDDTAARAATRRLLRRQMAATGAAPPHLLLHSQVFVDQTIGACCVNMMFLLYLAVRKRPLYIPVPFPRPFLEVTIRPRPSDDCALSHPVLQAADGSLRNAPARIQKELPGLLAAHWKVPYIASHTTIQSKPNPPPPHGTAPLRPAPPYTAPCRTAPHPTAPHHTHHTPPHPTPPHLTSSDLISPYLTSPHFTSPTLPAHVSPHMCTVYPMKGVPSLPPV